MCSIILRDNIELTHTHGLSCFVSFLISEAQIGRVGGIEGNLHDHICHTYYHNVDMTVYVQISYFKFCTNFSMIYIFSLISDFGALGSSKP